MSVYVIATMDTKGTEAEFVAERIRRKGVKVTLVDVGSGSEAVTAAEIGPQEVFQAAGTSLEAVREANDRGQAVSAAAAGVAHIVSHHASEGRVSGVLSLGGSAGTTIGTAAMRALPLGIPKLMVSTLASGQVRPYVGDKDILMMNAVVDVAGINRISRAILGNAAAAMTGMVLEENTEQDADDDRPLIAATMFGVTTPCVEQARKILEAAGYEVLVFHATGNGGQAMESLIRDGLLVGVLDLTTTELADELVGGILSAGPERLTAAAKAGLPQVVSVGATDMVNFGTPDSVPESLRERVFYQHNPTVTLMRTTIDENTRLGSEIATKTASARGPSAIMLPLRGVSAIDCEDMPFDDPKARAALFEAIRANRGTVELIELDCHINDPEFANAAARKLIALIEGQATPN